MAAANGRDSHAIVDSCENDDIVKFLDLFLMFKRLTTNVKLGLREKRDAVISALAVANVILKLSIIFHLTLRLSVASRMKRVL